MDMSFRCSPLAVLRRSGEFGEFLGKSMMWWLQPNLWSVSFGIFMLFSSAGHGLEHHIIDFPSAVPNSAFRLCVRCLWTALDTNANSCPGLSKSSETQSRNGQFWKIARKSIMWCSRLCPADGLSMKRPKLSPGGCKKGGLMAENRFLLHFWVILEGEPGSGHAWPRLSAPRSCQSRPHSSHPHR